MTRSEKFLSTLRAGGVLVADGATGTMLQRMGLPAGVAPEAWVLDRPDQIRALHRGYVEAGSDIILTCTFGGTRYRLEGHGLADRVVEVNRRAAALARETAAEAGRPVFVAGDMGPTGQLFQPFGPLTAEDAAEAYAEQARGLVEVGVDLILVETMSDLQEAQAAIAGARRVSRSAPLVCTFSFDTHGRTMMGLKPETAALEIGPLVEAVGANCGQDPAEYVGFMQAMRQAAPQAILWAKPNAGLPRIVDDQVVYDASPESMAQIATQLREAGAQIIGGCCGTTPEHIVAIAASLNPAP